jgi:glyceraldehyde 3-phosphate dehydrogenase
MGKIRVGINGMGRIGRAVLRILATKATSLEVVAVNNPGIQESYVHLIKYDSCHGTMKESVTLTDGILQIGTQKIKFFSERDPIDIPWEKEDVDLVIDSTGRFKDMESLKRHLKGKVKKVIMCAPGKDLNGTFVMGINHKKYNPEKDHIISNASCTTNCLAPIAKILNQNFTIISGHMTTVHSYTLDQRILDGSHKDKRRTRAAALNMIPTTTGAASALGLVIPELEGKLHGFSIRVPTPNVSLVDFSVVLKASPTSKEVNHALKIASENELKGILQYTEEELVSQDFLGNPHSSIIDASLTQSIGNHTKVIAWYDNEIGFSNRVVDLATYIAESL